MHLPSLKWLRQAGDRVRLTITMAMASRPATKQNNASPQSIDHPFHRIAAFNRF